MGEIEIEVHRRRIHAVVHAVGVVRGVVVHAVVVGMMALEMVSSLDRSGAGGSGRGRRVRVTVTLG